MLSSFFQGLGSYLQSLDLLGKLRLWKYLFIPMLIGLGLVVLFLFLAFSLSDNLGNWIIQWYPWEFGKKALTVAAHFLSGVVVVAFGLLLFRHLILILSGPFMTPLSEKIETHLYGDLQRTGPQTFSGALIRGLRISLKLLFKELFYTLLVILLSFMLGLGFLSPALLFLIQAYYAGAGAMDFTLERYFGVNDSLKFIRKNKILAISVGAGYVLMLMTVVGFLFATPISTVAATKAALSKLRNN